MIQQSKNIVSFDLELLFTNILIDTALQACLVETGEWSTFTSTKSNHGPPELCMEIYTLPWKWINCEKTEGVAMGSPFPLLLVTSTWRDAKNKQSHHHLTYTGVAYWIQFPLPLGKTSSTTLGQQFLVAIMLFCSNLNNQKSCKILEILEITGI